MATIAKVGGPFEYQGSSVSTDTKLVDLTNETSSLTEAISKITNKFPDAVLSFFCDPWDDG